jgi:hypothetical protein
MKDHQGQLKIANQHGHAEVSLFFPTSPAFNN